jgi:phytanoyl-CoA hydroxylase
VEKIQIPFERIPETPTFRSRFGGLWTDRRDAHEILDERRRLGRYSESEAERLAHYIDLGYVILPGATDPALIDEYLDYFDQSFANPPPGMMARCQGQRLPLGPDLYDRIAKVDCLHLFFPRAAELIFPQPVLEFLTDIYERPPVAFQTMTMRKGSEERLHIDTGPLTLTEPMTLTGSWIALEDVQPLSGEFEFVPGTHLLPETLHHGVAKGHDDDMVEHHHVLTRTLELAAENGLETERFMAKKGDVLIWHGDLMHGGAKIQDPALTRKSMVAHCMPLGVMPNFYDFSRVGAYPYGNGGYCLDNLLRARPKVRPGQAVSVNGRERSREGKSYVRRIKDLVPLAVRSSVRKQVDHLVHNRQH